jgi:hypothetical protein
VVVLLFSPCIAIVDNMTIKQAVAILIDYNDWRQGEEMPQPSPATITKALKIVIEALSE